jgi:hypothetical protein
VSVVSLLGEESSLRTLESLREDLDDGPGSWDERVERFTKAYPRALADVRRTLYRHAGMFPVPIRAVTSWRYLPADVAPTRANLVPVGRAAVKGLNAGYFATHLWDGTLGYFQRRQDDCLQAAIASLVQAPMHEVPDLQINKLIASGIDPGELEAKIGECMDRWLERCGLTVVFHTSKPTSARRWIGVVGSERLTHDHCLLMSGRECLFDPDQILARRPDEDPTELDPADIDYAITIERR